MTNIEDPNLNDLLAEFTDTVLNGDVNIEDIHNQDNLLQEKKTILQLKKAVHLAYPNAVTHSQIRRNVIAATSKRSENPLRNFLINLRKINKLALAGSLALILLSSLMMLSVYPSEETTLIGTANSVSPLILFLIVSGFVLIATIVWFNHHQK